jgi:hypothetical protein
MCVEMLGIRWRESFQPPLVLYVQHSLTGVADLPSGYKWHGCGTLSVISSVRGDLRHTMSLMSPPTFHQMYLVHVPSPANVAPTDDIDIGTH